MKSCDSHIKDKVSDLRSVSDSFHIQTVEGKGLGAVAGRDIQAGELILSEPALILSKQETSDTLTANQARQIFKQVAILNKDQREQMMELHCQGEKKILNIYRLNCIQVDQTYFGLYLKISRVNHSCCPNSVDCSGPVKELRAMKHIRKGEEITMSYIVNSWDIRMNRRSELSYWQFSCDCEACNLTGVKLSNNENTRKKIVETDDKVSKFVEDIIVIQDNFAHMPEDDRRMLQCQIFVSVRQMARVAEDKLDLLYKLKHQMLRQLFTAHLHCLLLYCKARAIGVLPVEEADRRVLQHGAWLGKMADWCKDWRAQLAQAVGRGIMFSVWPQGGVHYS